MAITAMLRKLLVIRATDSMALTLASMTVALTMTERGGVDGYARFVVIILVGTTAGGPLAYLALNVWRIPVFAPLIATVSAGSRIVLVLVLIIAREQSWPLEVAGLLVAASSVSLTSMFHSLISVGGGSIQDRTNLLSATAVGSLAGTLGAGLVIEWNWWPALVIMQAVAGAAGFLLVRIYVRAFLRQPQPVPIAVRPRLRDGLPSWSRMGPIVWRVPVIAGVAFAIGSTVLTRVVDIRRPRVGSWFADQRRWFLAATAGSLPWLLLVGPLWLGMIAVMIAGTILHLIQAGYEQAAAALDVPERSGPLIVALASVAGVASAVSIAVMPMIVTRIGFVNLVITVIVIMTTLALLDRRRARNVAAC
jgi:hypothetical protein